MAHHDTGARYSCFRIGRKQDAENVEILVLFPYALV